MTPGAVARTGGILPAGKRSTGGLGVPGGSTTKQWGPHCLESGVLVGATASPGVVCSLPGGSGRGLSVTLLRLSTFEVSLVVVSFFTVGVETVLNCLTTTGLVRTAENERIPPIPPLARASLELRVTMANAAIARLESMLDCVFMVVSL